MNHRIPFDIDTRITEIRLAKIQMAAFIFVHITPRGTKIAGRILESTNTLYAFTHSRDWVEALDFWCHRKPKTQPVPYGKWRERQMKNHKANGTAFPGWEHYENLWREKTRAEILHRLAVDVDDEDVEDLDLIVPEMNTSEGSLGRAESEWVRMLRGEKLTLDLRGDTTGLEELHND